MDPPLQGGPPEGRREGRDGGDRRRQASRRTEASGAEGVSSYGGSRSVLRGWEAPGVLGEATGGDGRARGLPVAANC